MKGRERQQLNIRMHEKKYEEENFFSVRAQKKFENRTKNYNLETKECQRADDVENWNV